MAAFDGVYAGIVRPDSATSSGNDLMEDHALPDMEEMEALQPVIQCCKSPTFAGTVN